MDNTNNIENSENRQMLRCTSILEMWKIMHIKIIIYSSSFHSMYLHSMTTVCRTLLCWKTDDAILISSLGLPLHLLQNLFSVRTWKSRAVLCFKKHLLCQFPERQATGTYRLLLPHSKCCWQLSLAVRKLVQHGTLPLTQTNKSARSGQISGEVISKCSFLHPRWLSWRLLFSQN